MKKLLLVLACAASLGLWMSCENEPQELDVTLHSGLSNDYYKNHGTATATKVTMVTKNTNIKVTYADDAYYGSIPKNMPTDGKGYFIGYVETLKTEGDVTTLKNDPYWFYNEWDSGTKVEFDVATVSWRGDVVYNNENQNGTISDTIVSDKLVSNGKTYRLSLEKTDNNVNLSNRYKFLVSGGTVKIDDSYDYATAPLTMTGSFEGNFTINASLKQLDKNYEDYLKPTDIDNGRRLDEYTTYSRNYNYTNGKREYVATKHPANISVYYLKDVAFTKN